MTQLEFAKGMVLLNAAYSNFETNQTVIEVWFSFFEDVRADVFIAAIKKHIRTSTFPPKVNELLNQCEIQGEIIQNDTLRFMFESGYFHKTVLNDADATKNYKKSLMWSRSKSLPEWLKNDMRGYYKKQITHSEQRKKLEM